MEEDYIVGYTLFGAKYNGFKTCHRHFSTLEEAKRFTSNVNIKDNSKIYVNIEAYKKLEEENKEFKKEVEKLTNARNWYFEHTTAEVCTPEMLHKILRLDYIPKQVIRDKIEECNKLCGNLNFGEWYYKNEILQELLEERNK